MSCPTGSASIMRFTTNWRSIACLTLALAGSPIAAIAQDCSAIQDDKKRLACYDKAAKPPPANNQGTAKPTVTDEQHSFRNQLKTTLLRAGVNSLILIDGDTLKLQLYGGET